MDHLTTDGAMVILSLLDLAAGLILEGHAALQATVATAAETAQYLDAVQGGYQASLYASLIEGFAPLQAAVDIHQHGFERVQIEAAQTVPQSIVPKGPLRADPALEMRVSQFAVQLLEAGQAKRKAMEDCQEYAGWRDLRLDSGVRHVSRMNTQIETFVQPGGKRRQGVRVYLSSLRL